MALDSMALNWMEFTVLNGIRWYGVVGHGRAWYGRVWHGIHWYGM